MNERDAFLKRLAENENDSSTRLDYADWLDDQREYDEADRQRAWPAAKAWLERFCKESSLGIGFSYPELIQFGKDVAEAGGSAERVYIKEDMWRALQDHSQEFWPRWSVVTGLPVPLSVNHREFHHWVCCAHDISYWFGTPDQDDIVEYTD